MSGYLSQAFGTSSIPAEGNPAGLPAPTGAHKLNTTPVTGNPTAVGQALVAETVTGEPVLRFVQSLPVGTTALDPTNGYTITFTKATKLWKAGAAASGSLITAQTPSAGTALSAAAQTVLKVTVPNDGNVHFLVGVAASKHVTSALTGGTLKLSWTCFGTPSAQTLTTPGTAVGWHQANITLKTKQSTLALKPGTSIILHQTAMTAGAGLVFAKIVVS